jgi:hypothetical protein
MVLPGACSEPAAVHRPARREPAARDPHRIAAGQGDVALAAARIVAARSNEAVSREEADGFVDGLALDDAVQVELEPDRAHEQATEHPHRAPVAGCACAGLLGTRLELVEVAVVPGCRERADKRRIDEPAGCGGGRERAHDHLAERLGHGHDLARRPVDAAQFAVRPETAELAVTRLEDALDRLDFTRRRPADLDDATHRAEAMDVHEVCVEVDGCPCEGASPPSSKNPKSSDSSEEAVGCVPLEVEWCAPRSAAIAPKNAITAVATSTVFAFPARSFAAAMRDRCGVDSDLGMRLMEPDHPESGVNGG